VTVLAAFESHAAARPHEPALFYYDEPFSYGRLDELADRFALGLQRLGVVSGERVAIALQNMPQFVVAMLATWKLGAIVVPINPAYRSRELAHIFRDAAVGTAVILDECLDEVSKAVEESAPPTLVLVGPTDWWPQDWPQEGDRSVTDLRHHTHRFDALVAEERIDARLRPVAPSETAMLTYTSGTTGSPKGAMNTHANVAFSSAAVREWFSLEPADRILAIAPLFHITGLVAYLTAALSVGAAVVLTFRFDPRVAIAVARRTKPTCTVAPITAFLALLQEPEVHDGALESLTKVASGGAPVPSATVERFVTTTGTYVHNAYGLTETTSVSLYVPLGTRSPVDRASGALSVGLPVPGTDVQIVSLESRQPVATGEVGEIVIRGPHVCAGYWRNPEASAEAIQDGWLRTGDVGVMDADGYFYVIDRFKDMINCAGYKVWPREVEDVIYEHPAVREAAVVGIPDEYRGESVAAFVVLRDEVELSSADIIEFTRDRLAPYKYPRQVTILPELPKTASGKVLRRALRDDVLDRAMDQRDEAQG
jgi:long-chain acyl-CoA synthetase